MAARRRSDPEKVAIALRRRRETTLTIQPIASRLSLGTPKRASTRLREWHIDHPDPTHTVHFTVRLDTGVERISWPPPFPDLGLSITHAASAEGRISRGQSGYAALGGAVTPR